MSNMKSNSLGVTNDELNQFNNKRNVGTLKSNSKVIDELVLKFDRITRLLKYLQKNSDLVKINPEEFKIEKFNIEPSDELFKLRDDFDKINVKDIVKNKAKSKNKKTNSDNNMLDIFNMTNLYEKYKIGSDDSVYRITNPYFKDYTPARNHKTVAELAEATAEWLKTVNTDTLAGDYIVTRHIVRTLMDETGVYSPGAYFCSVLFIDDVAKAYYDCPIKTNHYIFKKDIIKLQNKIKNKNAAD